MLDSTCGASFVDRRGLRWSLLRCARTTEVLQLANELLAYRVALDSDALVVALNLSHETQRISSAGATSVLAGQAALDVGANAVTVPPRGWAVLG